MDFWAYYYNFIFIVVIASPVDLDSFLMIQVMVFLLYFLDFEIGCKMLDGALCNVSELKLA